MLDADGTSFLDLDLDLDLDLTGGHDQFQPGLVDMDGMELELDTVDLIDETRSGCGFDMSSASAVNHISMGNMMNGWGDLNTAASSSSDLQQQPTAYSPISLVSMKSSPLHVGGEVIHNQEAETNGEIGNELTHDTACLPSQLASLSQRAKQAIHRLSSSERPPLTVSSSEVTEALEHTNTLIRIINNIIAGAASSSSSESHAVSPCPSAFLSSPGPPSPDSGRNNNNLKTLAAPTATLTMPAIEDCALAFSALASHQHLVTLFRAICDAIHRSLHTSTSNSKTERHRGPSSSSVAQFVMVLQLLMHLINRLDKSLLFSHHHHNHPSHRHHHRRQGSSLNFSTITVPVSVKTDEGGRKAQSESDEAGGSMGVGDDGRGGLIVLVQQTVGAIPGEHEKLRRAIQKLQAEMDHHSDLHG